MKRTKSEQLLLIKKKKLSRTFYFVHYIRWLGIIKEFVIKV